MFFRKTNDALAISFDYMATKLVETIFREFHKTKLVEKRFMD